MIEPARGAVHERQRGYIGLIDVRACMEFHYAVCLQSVRPMA
mgnify:CR=1|jgi:hypothetical protein